MDIKQINEELTKYINESNSNIDEIKALADYLEVPVEQIEQEEMHYAQYFYGLLNTYKVTIGKEEQEYYVTASYKNVKKAVEESVTGLFNDMHVSEFIKKVVPYLSNDTSYYISGTYRYNTDCYGSDYQGKFYAKRMAQDVIDIYGPGHELASYDNRTIEHDYNGKTYYIFRNN